ncbi:MAG: putative acyl-CoA dehydrogenase AidB [Paracidovorax wautersii]|uniref:Putative acyl-CoA dehydrogenase AidB n=1 Tax=Paracidovorax wautersii TaxID=1177982 RepID=A0A7V8FKK9_9BURK|nr:MAG: putative acyl-CoA dehydrogenase AidB [Paracidovorax wautersii]
MTDPTDLPADPARDGPAHNQVPPLEDYNLYTSDPVLAGAVRRAGAGAYTEELAAQGVACGAAATWRDAEDANRHEPELHTHNRLGERIDVVRFHPAWDRLMDLARRHGVANRSFFDADAHAWTVRAASHFMHCQVESGSTCPTTMTHAAIPVLRRNAGLYAALQPLLAARSHDARDLPLTHKSAMTLGMGMTERQGGSDVRTNTTRAVPALGDAVAGWGDAFVISGSKWFFSAPMCDAHLVLAREQAGGADGGGEGGLSCFFVPRWRPDGRKNAVHIQRLKDKLGNRSNASAEVDFDKAWGVRVGDAGRGVATILEMATHTRLDCALSSAAFMRQGLAQALHHARGRIVFGRALAQQPLMQAVLADLALESEGATLLAMDLAARFGRAANGQATPLDLAWRRLLTPVAKYWNCKRAVAFAGEAMEVLGGNGYVEEAPLARLFREAPVNSIWEGSGNVMCLDVLRAVAHEPDDARLLLGHLADVARQAAYPALLALVGRIEGQIAQPPAVLEGQARLLAQRLALAAQCALVLQFGGNASAGAFVQTRLDADWGAAWGGVPVPGAEQILAQAWADGG